MSAPLYGTSVELAYLEAERVRAEAEAKHQAQLEEAARAEWDAHIYDPVPDRHAVPDPRFYEGTGIGRIYDSLGEELEGWLLVPGSNRP